MSPSPNTTRQCDPHAKIGVAGYMGSGKSTLSQLLACPGAEIIDADREAKALYEEDEAIRRELSSAFGSDIMEKGRIRYDILGRRAFETFESLLKLNAIVHPALIERLNKKMHEPAKRARILDAALIPLLEKDSWFTARIWVEASRVNRMERLERNNSGLGRNELIQRMTLQERLLHTPENREWLVVNNDGGIEDLRISVDSIRPQIFPGSGDE